jgi:hypothetical protein
VECTERVLLKHKLAQTAGGHSPYTPTSSSPASTLRRHRNGRIVTDVKPGDWITLAGVIVAVFSAGFAVWSARRARAAQEQANHYQARAEQAAERATKAAEDAAVAQRESAAAEKRTAAALEKQNQMTQEQVDLDEGAPWDILHREGDIFELWNQSKRPKFKVTISGPGVSQGHPPAVVDRVDGNRPVQFYGSMGWGDDLSVMVTWYNREDCRGDPKPWTGIRPPKR